MIKILLPLITFVEELIGDVEEGAAGGGRGSAHQFHVGFFGGPPRFFTVAFHTGANDIFPGVLAVAETGHDVVEGEVFTLHTAVLAGVTVAVKDFIAGHFALATGAADKLLEP